MDSHKNVAAEKSFHIKACMKNLLIEELSFTSV